MKLWFKLIYTESVRILTDVISGTEVHQQHQKRQIQDYQNKDRFSVDRILSLKRVIYSRSTQTSFIFMVRCSICSMHGSMLGRLGKISQGSMLGKISQRRRCDSMLGKISSMLGKMPALLALVTPKSPNFRHEPFSVAGFAGDPPRTPRKVRHERAGNAGAWNFETQRGGVYVGGESLPLGESLGCGLFTLKNPFSARFARTLQCLYICISQFHCTSKICYLSR